MQSKTLPISLRLPPETKAALERAAKADHRSLSSLMEKILTDWLTTQAKAKKPKTAK
ncbi:MAG: ribbon-helix-helix protein, CopG family [Rhizomicrobium sp.]